MSDRQSATWHKLDDQFVVVRHTLAYLFAYVLPSVLIWCGVALLEAPVRPLVSVTVLMLIVFFSAWVTVPVTAFCGFPFHALCRLKCWDDWYVFVLGGAFIGLILTPLVMELAYRGGLSRSALAMPFTGLGLFFCSCGAVSAYGFWVMIYATPQIRRMTFFWPMGGLILLALVSGLIPR